MKFKDKLESYYSEKQLNEEQLNILRKSLEVKKKPRAFKLLHKFIFSLTSLCLLGGLFFINVKESSLEDKIVTEVSLNHIKYSKKNYEKSTLSDLNESLTKLPFTLVASSKMKDYEFLGGKYCSVQGEIAAQLAYWDDQKKERITLYQVKLNKHFKTLPLSYKKVFKDKVLIDFYQEGDVLLIKAINQNS